MYRQRQNDETNERQTEQIKDRQIEQKETITINGRQNKQQTKLRNDGTTDTRQ